MWVGMSRSAVLSAWVLSRAPGVEVNPTLATQRANLFATKTAGLASTTLLLRREQQTMRGYLITADHSPAHTDSDGLPVTVGSRRAAVDLAYAVGARAVPTEIPVGLDLGNWARNEAGDATGKRGRNVVGWLVYESGSSVARDPQVNADPTETARLLANTLPDGSWVAVTIRKPSKKERTRSQRWLSHRLSTAVPNHHSLSADAVVVSVYAGGPDKAAVRSYLEATRSAMPGFDVITRSRVATHASTLMPWLLGGLVSLAAAGLTTVNRLPRLAGLADVAAPTAVSLTCLGGVMLAVGVLRFLGVLPSAWRRTQAMARECRFRPPPRRLGRPRPPRPAVTTGDQQIPAYDGEYPLHPAAFLAGPQVVIGVVAPHAGAESGERQTRARSAPPALLQRVGPLIGDTDHGPAYLSARDQEGQTALAGRAGSGKTQLVRSLFGWASVERMHPCGLPGFPGAANTLVAFESKGTGLPHYQAWAEATGDTIEVIDLADPSSLAIDLLDVGGTVFDKATFFVNALKYYFGDQAIGDQSFETLLGVLPAALLINPELAGLVPDLNPNGSAIYYVHVLLGGRGDDLGRALAAELAAESIRPDADPAHRDVLREAVLFMSPLYGPNATPASRRNLQQAPRNKFRQLIELESWWTPTRPKTSWREILTGHRAVVINTGLSPTGVMVEDTARAQLSAFLMYSLRHAIQRVCAGWQRQGRSVSLFADELALLAGATEDVIAWLKDQGREYGVRSYLATQRPAQLPEKVREAFLNFSTLITFTQESNTAATEIAKEVSTEEGEWTGPDILQLRQYTAVVRTHVDKTRHDAFTIRVRNFEADRSAFAQQQGYPMSTTSAVAIGTETPDGKVPPDVGAFAASRSGRRVETGGTGLDAPSFNDPGAKDAGYDESGPDLMSW